MKQATWAVDFSPTSLPALPMYDSVQVNFTTSDFTPEELQEGRVFWLSDNVEVAQTQSDAVLLNTQNISQGKWKGSFDVMANFIGYTEVKMVLEGEFYKYSNIFFYFYTRIGYNNLKDMSRNPSSWLNIVAF